MIVPAGLHEARPFLGTPADQPQRDIPRKEREAQAWEHADGPHFAQGIVDVDTARLDHDRLDAWLLSAVYQHGGGAGVGRHGRQEEAEALARPMKRASTAEPAARTRRARRERAAKAGAFGREEPA